MKRIIDENSKLRRALCQMIAAVSAHKEYAKGKDPFYTTRCKDFARAEKVVRKFAKTLNSSAATKTEQPNGSLV